MVSAGNNWEAEQLEQSLAKRVRAGWGAYWVAGRQEPPPVAPIALTGGIPDPETLPIDLLIEASNNVLRREGPEALRYGGHQGSEALREWLSSFYSERDGLTYNANNFTITNGISGAILNVCETFIDEGDVGLSETPTFPGGAGTIEHCLGEIVGVPVDNEGLDPDGLESIIVRLQREGRRVKLLYTTPNFQNPTGTMLPSDRRHAVVEICRRYGVLIMEDDAYGDIRFSEERLPSLFALAGGKGAVFLGTYSKTVATGLRVGWVLADEPVIQALLRTRFDLGTSPWMQRTLLEFSRNGRLDDHVKNVNAVYRRKRDVMLSALDERCSRFANWNVPEGGYFLWLSLAPDVDPSALYEAARQEGVAYVGGAAFHRDGAGRENVRLAYSFVAEADIPEAVMRLGRAMEEASRPSSK
jgi:DNA-binding transcriptional MocR family regulator